MNNLQEFFAMGGYAFYVWTSYGLTLIVLLANIIMPVLQRKQFLRSLVLKQKR
ncbi:MAG: heme exporter protein CcmD [Pseudomonadota bacterium]|jgi:heme exporter protein D